MVMSGQKRFNYQPKSSIVRFEDMPGLEMVMAPVPVGKLMDMFVAADGMREGKATAEMIAGLFGLFAGVLRSWTLDCDGVPVPPTLEGIRSLDPDLFMTLFNGWANGLMQAPKASPPPSKPGQLPEEMASLPMAPLSVVQAS
jgi:hypothetical protein